MDNPTTAADIVAEVGGLLAEAFEMVEWAESEIAQAQKRHPDQADTLFHSFSLLSVRDGLQPRIGTEIVYRAHARELLERVAAGQDTRPGTAAEVVIGLLAAATHTPLTHEGFGLCSRMWEAAGLPDVDGLSNTLGHYEAISGARLDDEERNARHACRDASRKLRPLKCIGLHHGEAVSCLHAEDRQAA